MSILTFLFSPLGRIAAGAFAVLSFIGLFAWDQQNRGAEKAVAKIEKATDHAASKASRAADGSRDDSVRGTVDPGYRD